MQPHSPSPTRQRGAAAAPWLFVLLAAIALSLVLREPADEADPKEGQQANQSADLSGDQPAAPLPVTATVIQQPKGTEPIMQGGLPDYRFSAPDRIWELPEELAEISGIALTGPATLACIEDEQGRLYTLDLEGDGAVTRTKFGRDGDYEALARAGDRLVVMRSDGVLRELSLQGDVRRKSRKPLKDLPYEEYESLAFEPAQERWLVLPKDAVKEGDRTRDDRVIFGLGFEDLDLAPEPVLVLSRKGIIQEAEEHDWPLPTDVNKKGKEKIQFAFRPSDLAVHPVTGDYFIVSGPDRTLIAVSPEGVLLGTATFPESLLQQPEGLAFQPSGDLLIASEGDGRAAVLVQFSYRGK